MEGPYYNALSQLLYLFIFIKLHFTKINLPRLEIITKGTDKSNLEIFQKGLRYNCFPVNFAQYFTTIVLKKQ